MENVKEFKRSPLYSTARKCPSVFFPFFFFFSCDTRDALVWRFYCSAENEMGASCFFVSVHVLEWLLSRLPPFSYSSLFSRPRSLQNQNIASTNYENWPVNRSANAFWRLSLSLSLRRCVSVCIVQRTAYASTDDEPKTCTQNYNRKIVVCRSSVLFFFLPSNEWTNETKNERRTEKWCEVKYTKTNGGLGGCSTRMGGMKNARTKYEKKIAKSARSESGGNSQSENLFKIHRASHIATKDCHTHTHTEIDYFSMQERQDDDEDRKRIGCVYWMDFDVWPAFLFCARCTSVFLDEIRVFFLYPNMFICVYVSISVEWR